MLCSAVDGREHTALPDHDCPISVDLYLDVFVFGRIVVEGAVRKPFRKGSGGLSCARRDDPLAGKNLIREENLYGRTLMVGGGSPQALRAVQHRLIATGKIDCFNSPDHDTTRTNVAAERGVCLAPGFLNDHSGEFAWIPYDCEERFSCVLLTHREDVRKPLSAFISMLKTLYDEAVAFPL